MHSRPFQCDPLPTVTEPPGAFQKCGIWGSTPNLLNHNLHFNKISVKFEGHQSLNGLIAPEEKAQDKPRDEIDSGEKQRVDLLEIIQNWREKSDFQVSKWWPYSRENERIFHSSSHQGGNGLSRTRAGELRVQNLEPQCSAPAPVKGSLQAHILWLGLGVTEATSLQGEIRGEWTGQCHSLALWNTREKIGYWCVLWGWGWGWGESLDV